MDFKTFNTKLTILNKTERSKLRDRYIKKFINVNHELYQEQIQSKKNCLDGYCYGGYLWDYIKDPVIIDKDYIEAVAKNIDKVYVFWDIHSHERIFIKNYWKFDKDAILQLSLKTLLEGENFLPEDIYIFDNTITWTLIKTHEDIDGKCYCLKSGQI